MKLDKSIEEILKEYSFVQWTSDGDLNLQVEEVAKLKSLIRKERKAGYVEGLNDGEEIGEMLYHANVEAELKRCIGADKKPDKTMANFIYFKGYNQAKKEIRGRLDK